MSGKPYPEGVSQVIEMLDQQAEVIARIDELAPKVNALTCELDEATARKQQLSAELAHLLDTMDLEAQGNFGFGGRMAWFLAMMRKLLLARKGDKDNG